MIANRVAERVTAANAAHGRRAAERHPWQEILRAPPSLVLAAGFGAAAAACWLALAVILARVVAAVFLGRQGLAAVTEPILLMAALVLLRGGLLWAAEVMAQRGADGVKQRLRGRIARKLVDLGPLYVRGQRAGELVYVAGEAVEALDGYFTRYWPARALSAVVPVMVGLLVLALDPWALLILLFAWPILILLLALIGIRVRDLTERRERELAWLNGLLLDLLQGLPTLKLFGRSADAAETIRAASARHGAATLDVLRVAFQASLVLEWGAVGGTALVAIETSVRVMTGGLPFDHALAVLLLAPEFFLPLRKLSLEYHAGRAGAAAAQRIQALLGQPVPARRGRFAPLPARNDLVLDGVQVIYEGRAALDRCSLEVAQGQTLALVGPTGAGKTTVVNLLLRFVEPAAGRVEVGGVPLGDLDPGQWRSRIAWVPQHPSLFHGSVADNIRLAKPQATDGEVVAAARAAQAHAFIEALPAGYATPIGEDGARLSGGERQRLALARAYLKEAPVLILDEPTSHLDAACQESVLQSLRRLGAGRTVILIAHHLPATAEVDLVAVMDAGRVVDVVAPRFGAMSGAPSAP